MTATAITAFNFNSHDVRVVVQNGEPWFVATDVAESLGYKSPKDAASYLDDDEKGSATVRTPGGDQKLTVINESGLYALVLRSRKPEARKFAKWVTSEVLPSIRKTGTYSVSPEATSQQVLMAMQAANAISSRVQEHVFGQMMQGRNSFCMDRWLVSFNHSKDGPIPVAQAIEREAFVTTARDFPKHIGDGGACMSNEELVKIAAACNQKLARRFSPQRELLGT